MRDYIDTRFGRFLLYLLVYQNQAQDWDEHGHRLGFEGTTVLSDFRPQWHHVFPQKHLEGKVDESLINALANIAVIGPEINIRINARDPMSYVAKYGITEAKLKQQFIAAEIVTVTPEHFEVWLRNRASVLAEAGNKFLANLRQSL